LILRSYELAGQVAQNSSLLFQGDKPVEDTGKQWSGKMPDFLSCATRE